MNVLILDGTVPDSLYSGKSVRLVNLFARLARRHALHYATIPGPGDPTTVPDWLAKPMASVQVWPRRAVESPLGRVANWLARRPWFYARWRYPEDYRQLSRTIDEFVRAQRIELIHCVDDESAQFVPATRACAWLMDPADAMSLHARRRRQGCASSSEWWHWHSIAWRLDRYERDIIRRADATVFVSPVDAAVHAFGPRRAKIHVAANGVDTAYFSPDAPAEDEVSARTPAQGPMVILTGHMSFPPNHDAAMRLITGIMPHVWRRAPQAVACFAGADPKPELAARHDGQRVLVTGKVTDLRPWMGRATVYACPMRLGAGIKNKLLEAMAMSKAIVTTARGAEGIDATDGHELVLAETDEECAARIVELICTPARRDALGRAARELVVRSYSWETTAQRYEALYAQLAGARRRGPGPVSSAAPSPETPRAGARTGTPPQREAGTVPLREDPR